MINATVSRMSSGGWLFTWPVGTPDYTIWLDGLLLDTVSTEEYECELPGYEDTPPDLEILNDGETAENYLYPPFQRLQWRGLLTAVAYVVEELIGVVWVPKITLMENGRGYYTWKSPAQADGETAQYRVKAVDVQGNGGAELPFSIEVCRNPQAPDVEFEIDSTGDIVVSEG